MVDAWGEAFGTIGMRGGEDDQGGLLAKRCCVRGLAGPVATDHAVHVHTL